MYEIKRANNRVRILKGSEPVFDSADTSYIIYMREGHQIVSLVKDLEDADLLLALANAVLIKE
jgi:hypothetical protein